MRTSNHENFDFWVWGIFPGEQISSEIRHSLPGPACVGVPGPSLQEEEERPVSKSGRPLGCWRAGSRAGPWFRFSSQGVLWKEGLSIPKQSFFKQHLKWIMLAGSMVGALAPQD